VAVLTGTSPGELNADLSPRTYPAIAKVLPIGNRAIAPAPARFRAAERRLARQRNAKALLSASLFPQVSVSGFVGFLAAEAALFYRELESLFRFSRPIVVGV